MSQVLTKKAIRSKTVQLGSLTLLSRAFGLIREVLLGRFLGSGMVSDAFFTAFKVPNMLRKIFAEGALSAAFVPRIVQTVRQEGKDEASKLITLSFLVFEFLLLILSIPFVLFPRFFMFVIAPGFNSLQIDQTAPMIVLLMPFIFFISASAIFAGALQADHHFFIPAFSPVLFNIVLIIGLLLGMHYHLPASFLCISIVCGGIAQVIAHYLIYRNLGFSFKKFDRKALSQFGKIFINFIVCAPSVSLSEISAFIDTSFASYIPGAISSVSYASRFMGIPLGVFATSFSTILLPHFTRVTTYAPRRLGYYLLESSKLIIWVTLPAGLWMMFFARNIFQTLFLSSNFPMHQVIQASYVLIASLTGLVFFSLNKTLTTIFYAHHQTALPTVIACVATIINICCNVLLMPLIGAPGLALGTTIGAMVQTGLSLLMLSYKIDVTLRPFNKSSVGIHLSSPGPMKFYPKAFLKFITGFAYQLAIVMGVFLALYYGVEISLHSYADQQTNILLLESIWMWFWVGPLVLGSLAGLYYSRKFFGINLYFID